MPRVRRVFALILLLSAALAAQQAAAPRKPRLVLAIVIDQFRYDFLTRYRSEYTGGLNRLLTRGAVYTNANYEHFHTFTAPGHATFLSGAFPSVSGIIGNDWFEPASGKRVTSVTDGYGQAAGRGRAKAALRRGAAGEPVGDELKNRQQREIARVLCFS